MTKEVLVQLESGTDAEALAGQVGAISRGEVPYARGFFIFETVETGGALNLAEALRGQPGVITAEPQLAKQQKKKLVPNDTYFTNQWHLLNTGQKGGTPGIDVNITNVWDTYRGAGILIGIVDDGLQYTHPDLTNSNTVIDWDWNGNDSDPSPNVNQDYHGTSCAGVAAAAGNNARGVAGAAFASTLVGMRLIAAATTDAQEASAMSHSNDLIFVKSNSWGPADDGVTLEGPGPLTTNALFQGVTTGRGGKGVIYVWAGGNGLGANDNANYDGYANSIYTIAVAALSDQGNQASYSEPGACLVVTAPSSSSGRQGITTTDLMGNKGYNKPGASGEIADQDYTQTFGGTSSSTPLVAGVVALMLQANPNLGWRDVQEILMKSATKVSPADSDWITNGGSFNFNHKFGAGLVNARAAINLATNWTNLRAQTNIFVAQTGLSIGIPDNNTTGITRNFDFSSSNLRAEHVTVTVNITHPYRGDLAVTLTSPNGTQSRLAEKHSDPGDNYANWKFMSVRNWSENSAGIWTVKIADLAAADVGTLTSIRVDIFGTSLAPPPQLVVNPASRDYGVLITGQSSNQTFSVINTGGETLTGTASVGSPFSVIGGSPYSVLGGQTGVVTVSFSPVSAGFFSNAVIFSSNGGNSTNTVTGSGITPAALGVGPEALNFGTIAVGATAQASFVVTNSGGATLDGTAAVPSGPFAIVSGSPFSVAGFGSTNVVISFTPETAGTFSTNVVFTSNGGNSTNPVTGTGAILPAANFSGTPTNGLAPLTVTFTDTSTGTITNRHWSFGDGATSNTLETSVVHTYNAAGTNTVRLIVSGPLGVSTNTKPNYIIVTNLLPAANMAIAKSGSPNPVTLGHNLTYTVTVTNLGPSTATSVTVTDALPASVSFVSATPTQGSCSNQSGLLTCDLGSLASNAIATVTIVVTPTSSGLLTNTANVASAIPDPNLANNTSTAIVTVPVDADGDQMDDAWELAHGLNPDDPGDALLDADGDGFTNVQEFYAGTDPNDASSAPRITAIEMIGADVLISFTTESGKTYAVEWTDTFPAVSWNSVTNNVAGTGGVVQVIDSGAAGESKRLYRVGVGAP